MRWFNQFQQRLSLTKHEAMALFFLSGLLILGSVVKHIEQRASVGSQEAYDEFNRMFFERAARLDSSLRRDSVLASEPVDADAPDRFERSGATGSEAGPIDINSASAPELERLPRIGPKTAARIIAFRERYGRFISVEDLEQISGIGPKTVALLAPLVTTDSDSLAR